MNKNKLHDLIIMSVTGFSKDQLFLNKTISKEYKNEIREKIIRLELGEPIEYIINKAEFYGLDFFVDSRVLIPRDDTEVMVDEVLKEIKVPSTHYCSFSPSLRGVKGEFLLVDIGTGSGCIPISILKNTKKINKCIAIDVSKDALDVARINVENHGLKDRVELVEGILFEPFLKPLSSPPFTEEGIEKIVITANLPYIKQDDHKNMDSETIKFEPDLALYGGENTGFELYEKLIKQCIELIPLLGKEKLGVVLFIEIGFDQKKICEDYLNNLNLYFKIFKDNSGINRCVKIEIN